MTENLGNSMVRNLMRQMLLEAKKDLCVKMEREALASFIHNIDNTLEVIKKIHPEFCVAGVIAELHESASCAAKKMADLQISVMEDMAKLLSKHIDMQKPN